MSARQWLAVVLIAGALAACAGETGVTGSFELSLSPAEIEIVPGESAATLVTVRQSGGFAGPVEITLADPPEGVSAEGVTVAQGSSAALSVHVADTASVGDYVLTVRGESSELAREAALGLKVTASPPEILSFEATPAAIAPGETSLLSWEVRDAESLTLEPGSIDVGGLTSYGVAPEVSTSYTLHAGNAAGSARASATVTVEEVDEAFRILAFSRTLLYRHASIPAAAEALRALGEVHGFAVDHSENPADFTAENLERYAAVVFLMPSGRVLNALQQRAFEGYIQSGGGFVGVHSATVVDHDDPYDYWPWYEELVGAYYDDNSGFQTHTLVVEDQGHPSTSHLGETWERHDEIYNFRSNPRGKVNVLVSLDVSSVVDTTMGADHPVTWYHDFDGGRSWYTSGGHFARSWREEAFLEHVLGGILYAAGRARPQAGLR